MSPSGQANNEVKVVFKDAALQFRLPRGATLEDLAERVAALEDAAFGEPVSIDVKLPH
jgi:hypothetical protein